MRMTNAPYPPVVVVDENDNILGSATLAEVWNKGLYHRIVSIFIVDSDQRMLLQLRSPQVMMYPNCWDQAAGGHVDEGFTYEQTAKKELFEELGLDGVKLEVAGTFRSNNALNGARIVNQFERVYIARVPRDVALRPDPEEVSAVQWFTSAELTAQITQHTEKFTPGLLYALRKYFSDF